MAKRTKKFYRVSYAGRNCTGAPGQIEGHTAVEAWSPQDARKRVRKQLECQQSRVFAARLVKPRSY
jgi:hypothetical protein